MSKPEPHGRCAPGAGGRRPRSKAGEACNAHFIIRGPISNSTLHYSICAIILSMEWTVETLNHTVTRNSMPYPRTCVPRFTHVVRLIESFGSTE